MPTFFAAAIDALAVGRGGSTMPIRASSSSPVTSGSRSAPGSNATGSKSLRAIAITRRPCWPNGIHVQEIDREDPGSLGCQELPPRRAGPTRRRVDARSMQDLPHGRRRNCHAELHELAVDPPVSPQRILPRQADDKAGDARACPRASWPAPLARVVLPRRQPAVPGQQRRGRREEDLGPAPARYKPRQRGKPGPVSRLIPHPAGVPPQYRVLMPEHQQLSIFRPVAAEHQDGQAEYPAREQVDDLEQHPAS